MKFTLTKQNLIKPFEQSLNQLFTNKYFLYFIAFLSVIMNLRYLLMNNINAVGFFVAIGIIMTKFSKNMAIVLAVCLVATTVLFATKTREGMDTASTVSAEEAAEKASAAKAAAEEAAVKAAATGSPEDIAAAEVAAKAATEAEAAAKAAKAAAATGTGATDATDATDATGATGATGDVGKTDETVGTIGETGITGNSNLPENDHTIITPPHTDVEGEPEETTDEASGFKPMHSQHGSKKHNLDYGASITKAYSDLNTFLDPAGIKRLTKDTSELMNQQNKLYSSMNSMTPLLTQAKSLLNGFDMSKLKGAAGM